MRLKRVVEKFSTSYALRPKVGLPPHVTKLTSIPDRPDGGDLLRLRLHSGLLTPFQRFSPLDESSPVQLQLDFRTGRPTTITGPIVTFGERAACSAINARRARGILQVSQLSPSRESLPPDVWAATFVRKTREWDVPLISLSRLGLDSDEDGFLESRDPEIFQPLRSGAEACPYVDRSAGVVYKLFFLLKNGALGKKLSYELGESGRFECKIEDATLVDTLGKLVTLHDAGGHATEIVGLSDDGKYLIAKQPLARDFESFEEDQEKAVQAIKGVPLSCQGISGRAILIWLNEQAWIVSDLHVGNIMRDAHGVPTIIDALTGAVPPLAYDQLRQVREAVQDARDLRAGRHPQIRLQFGDVDDRDL